VLELKVKKDDYNPLLKRKEVYVQVPHENEGSPSRSAVRDAVASKYGAKPENVYVVHVHTRTGTHESVCEVQVYDEAAFAKRTVPEYVKTRNLPSEERKKVKEQKAKTREEKPKPAPAKKEEKKEKPKEEPKAPAKEAKEGKEPRETAKEPKEAPKETPAKEPTKQPGKEGRAK
jgi:ribosomal protein S24E